jgi:hypothetical protein
MQETNKIIKEQNNNFAQKTSCMQSESKLNDKLNQEILKGERV